MGNKYGSERQTRQSIGQVVQIVSLRVRYTIFKVRKYDVLVMFVLLYEETTVSIFGDDIYMQTVLRILHIIHKRFSYEYTSKQKYLF